jgi:hypothetical protein
LATVVLALGLAACASSSVTATGAHNYPQLPASTPVQIFSADRDVPPGFQVVGIIDYDNPGKYQVLTLEDAIPDLQEKARSVGGNGVIVDESQPVKSGLVSTGIHVRARAIRLPGSG